jgi:TolA-binding protein
MAFGDVAKQALTKAMEVYEGLTKLAAIVQQMEARITDFRDESRKRMADFEQRVDNKATAIEARADRKIDAIEQRLRDLESRMAQLEGKATGALAEAYALVLSKHLPTGALPEGGDKR